MNLKTVFIAALICTFTIANAGPPLCGNFCKFGMFKFNRKRRLLPKAPFTILGAPKTAQLPFICRPKDDMGEVLRAREAQVFDGEGFVPISLNARGEFRCNVKDY